MSYLSGPQCLPSSPKSIRLEHWFSTWNGLAHLGDSGHCLVTVLVVTTRGCYWQLKGRGQRCCPVSCTAQDSPRQRRAPPRPPTAPRGETWRRRIPTPLSGRCPLLRMTGRGHGHRWPSWGDSNCGGGGGSLPVLRCARGPPADPESPPARPRPVRTTDRGSALWQQREPSARPQHQETPPAQRRFVGLLGSGGCARRGAEGGSGGRWGDTLAVSGTLRGRPAGDRCSPVFQLPLAAAARIGCQTEGWGTAGPTRRRADKHTLGRGGGLVQGLRLPPGTAESP